MSKANPKATQTPSSNWLALRKTLGKSENASARATKRRKTEHAAAPASSSEPSSSKLTELFQLPEEVHEPAASSSKHGPESKAQLRRMVLEELEYTEQQKLPGRYLALDCEMVGVGIDGSESSLARVSLVNYYGAIQLDEFVRQRERVVDYRTQYSGIREKDMIKAKPFDEVQKRVAELLKDRILVGHAVFNDLKALLLSHPRPQTRDTQYYAGKHKVVKSKYVALRNLVKQELDLTIQGGEHSSVTDARATMAVYRLHKHEWEKGQSHAPFGSQKKRKRAASKASVDGESDEEDEAEDKPRKSDFPGGGRKGVSSGLSTVVRRGGASVAKGRGGSGTDGKKSKSGWWKELGGASKGTMRSKRS
ncbi:hypothetical protein HGRIS_001726 [Hohenbuehelia grisea]|uniref:RNA exonuclease 4 n=1 Tax=Hohenbuehelia grisea TaxID=104357 RepID=A0ABR3JID0_9AGAR